MYTIITDQQITRNRRVHYVFDTQDVLMFSAPLLRDCIVWLKENEVQHFHLDFGDYIALLFLPKEPGSGQEKITGWLHKPKEAEPKEGAASQTASQLATS